MHYIICARQDTCGVRGVQFAGSEDSKSNILVRKQ